MSHLARNCTGSASVSCRRPQIAIEGIIDPQVQALIIVSAPGLYGLVMPNRKDAARRFQRWVKHEVLPSIQRTGGYLPADTQSAEDFILMRGREILEARAEKWQAVALQQTARADRAEAKVAAVVAENAELKPRAERAEARGYA